MKTFNALVGTTVATVALFSGISHAQELTGTLKKINDTGTINLGVRDFSVPFSYLDDKQQYQGYAIDLCMAAVKAVQRQLHLARLDINLVPVTASTRIPLLTNGSIDLECGNTTNNIERHAVVDFAPTMFISSGQFLTKKSAGIRSVADLRGKTVAASSGSSHIKRLTALNSEQGFGMQLVTVRDSAEGVLMVESGRAAAYVQDDIVLAALVASSKSPLDFNISGEPLSVEPFGIMQRRLDPQFKATVDGAIKGLYKTGEINAIYAKWFTTSIPPKGINLNWSMSLPLKTTFANPTDSGDPSVYAPALATAAIKEAKR